MRSHPEFEELLDSVEQEPGWRVERTTRGMAIYPPDRTAQIIHTSPGTDPHGFKNLQAMLRRAGFKPLIRQKKVKEDMGTTATAVCTDKPAPTLGLIDQARAQINIAIGALSEVEQLLGKIQGENTELASFRSQLKKLLG